MHLFQFNPYQLIRYAKDCIPTAMLKVFAIVVAVYHCWLPPIGNTEIESSKFFPQPRIMTSKILVLIIRPVLIKDIAHQPIIRR